MGYGGVNTIYFLFCKKNLWHLFPRKNEFLWGNNIEVKALVFLCDLIKKYSLRSTSAFCNIHMLDISKACILDFCYIIFEFMLVEKKYIQEGSIVGPCILKLILFSCYYFKSINKKLINLKVASQILQHISLSSQT